MKDPIMRIESILIKENIINEKFKEETINHDQLEINEAFEYAKKSSFPNPNSILEGVYAE